MKFKQYIFNSYFLLVLSFIILLMSVGSLLWIQNPPELNNLFSNKKLGVLNYSLPDQIMQGRPFTMEFSIDTQQQNVNAIGLYFLFETDDLQVLELDTISSFCQFYPEKKFDNRGGKISLACGSPHPGVSGTNTVMKLKFLPSSVGTTTIVTSPASQILLSDGKGTNVLEELPRITINVSNSL